jgi:hypothetical protein
MNSGLITSSSVANLEAPFVMLFPSLRAPDARLKLNAWRSPIAFLVALADQ